MPKALYIDPNETLRPQDHELELPKIPVMTYNKTVKEELKEGNFTKEDLLRIYRDMSYIREFETMLNLVKTTGGYNGVAYNNPGPAHLSAGQEAAAVGMAYCLDTDDFIFGSHRSHGEILAKGLRSIQILPEDELKKVMEEFWGGATLNVAKKAYDGDDTKELGIRFLLYGAMAEIFARTTGFNKGLGGSMHTFFTPFGIYPNNAIVGGSGSIAVGAALYKKVNRKKGIVVANLGDGAMARGPVLEGMTFASMDQFNTLWEGDMKGGLPVLFNVMDNQYAMGGQTKGETWVMCSLHAWEPASRPTPWMPKELTVTILSRSSTLSTARKLTFLRRRVLLFWTLSPTVTADTLRATSRLTVQRRRSRPGRRKIASWRSVKD